MRVNNLNKKKFVMGGLSPVCHVNIGCKKWPKNNAKNRGKKREQIVKKIRQKMMQTNCEKN